MVSWPLHITPKKANDPGGRPNMPTQPRVQQHEDTCATQPWADHLWRVRYRRNAKAVAWCSYTRSSSISNLGWAPPWEQHVDDQSPFASAYHARPVPGVMPRPRAPSQVLRS